MYPGVKMFNFSGLNARLHGPIIVVCLQSYTFGDQFCDIIMSRSSFEQSYVQSGSLPLVRQLQELIYVNL